MTRRENLAENMILSICIPTYNRAELLRECLASVIPQVAGNRDVEVVVTDNASPDHTRSVVEEFRRQYPALRYYRNETNLGYAGNQIKCLEYAAGDYLAILCDDDLYLPGLVEEVLSVLDNGEYVFIALNYFSFQSDVGKPYQSDFAPEKDVLFDRAYDVMNYPSVGHFSGFLFNARLARESLAQALSVREVNYFEKHRGVISELAARSTAGSTLPALFLGKRLVAARMPESVDYDGIRHLCLDYYDLHYNLFKEGIITDEDLAYRTRLVLSWLPRMIVVDVYRMTNSELAEATEKLKAYYGTHRRFRFICMPLLLMARNGMVKGLFRYAHAVKRYVKWGRTR